MEAYLMQKTDLPKTIFNEGGKSSIAYNLCMTGCCICYINQRNLTETEIIKNTDSTQPVKCPEKR